MSERPDQHQPSHARTPVLDYGRPRADEPAPILDYGPTEPARITFLGKSPSELLPISLAIELALQLFMSLLLDGGVSLRACSTAWLVYWTILAIELPRRGHRVRACDLIIWGVGLAAAVAGLLV